jgi:hypothetical protein
MLKVGLLLESQADGFGVVAVQSQERKIYVKGLTESGDRVVCDYL